MPSGRQVGYRKGNKILFQDDNIVVLDIGKGYSTTVDADDYPKIQNHTWRVQLGKNTCYCIGHSCEVASWPNLRLHRMIMNVSGVVSIDHIDSDGLNNRKSNLRLCTGGQNIQNSRRRKDNSSGYKGVHLHGHKWQARIVKDNKRVSIGQFHTPEEAALAYDLAAREHYGEFARTNF